MPVPVQPFSQRFSVPPKPPQSRPDEVPDSIRVKLVPLIDKFRGGRGLPGAYTIGPALYESLGKIPPQPTGDMHMIRQLFHEAEWWQIYDLAEALVQMCGRPEEIAAHIEGIFAEANVPYAMTPEGIVWRFSKPAVEVIKESTRLLVEDSALKGPAQQWQKAMDHLSERPPDSENSIKDAVGAVEGTGRILSGRENENLSKLIAPFAKKIGMHPTLAVMVDKLYAYRGDEQAVAHGATKELKATPAEAELVLHVSAALIVYLRKKNAGTT
jgi:hypothetical protein